MADEITTNPQRSERIVGENGLPSDQTIEWFDDLEIALNENLLGEIVQFKSYTVAQLKTIIAPATTPEIPAENFLDGVVIVSDESGGRTLATSDGTDWRRVSDGIIIT